VGGLRALRDERAVALEERHFIGSQRAEALADARR
jgi:hypothetical protein